MTTHTEAKKLADEQILKELQAVLSIHIHSDMFAVKTRAAAEAVAAYLGRKSLLRAVPAVDAARNSENAWRRHVLDIECLNDWKVEEGESYCYHDTKTIKLFPHDRSPSSFLHEVAHVFSPEPEGTHKNHFHGGNWFMQFQRLVDKYMMVRASPPPNTEPTK